MKLTRAATLSLFLTIASSARAENWPQWRGPQFNGSSSEKGLPSTWSKESVQWSATLPGASAATPIIWGDHVFVSSANEASKTLRALCFDRKSGKLLWDKQVGEGRIQRDDKSNFASPSPVANATRVF